MATATVAGNDVKTPSALTRARSAVTRRPELGAIAGAALVYLFFVTAAGDAFYSVAGMANWLIPAAELGLIAVPVAMLMIAGEFDLSVGSMTAATAMTVSVTVGFYDQPLWLGIVLALILAIVVGLFNGIMVVLTRLPSFIVTLATLFLLAGITIGLTKNLTSSTIVTLPPDYEDSPITSVLTGEIGRFSVEIVWWLVAVAVGTWVLTRTRFGNWIYSTGDDVTAARNMGVKVNFVKISLFVCTALAACIVSIMQVLTFGSGDVARGSGLEFQAVIAAVIGGCLLTGGYGTVIGAAFGALTFGMANLGINYAGWPNEWFQAFLGAMLLLAVVVNNYVRKLALESKL